MESENSFQFTISTIQPKPLGFTANIFKLNDDLYNLIIDFTYRNLENKITVSGTIFREYEKNINFEISINVSIEDSKLFTNYNNKLSDGFLFYEKYNIQPITHHFINNNCEKFTYYPATFNFMWSPKETASLKPINISKD